MTWSGELSVEGEDDPVTFQVRIVKVDPGNLLQNLLFIVVCTLPTKAAAQRVRFAGRSAKEWRKKS